MKIGIINFSTFSSGVNLVIRAILPNILEGNTVSGIEIDENGEMDRKEFTSKNIKKSVLDHREPLLPSFPKFEKISKLLLDEYDRFILFGNGNVLNEIEMLSNDLRKKILFIPVSIHSDITYSDTTLGYDTAMNSIVEMAFKIRDTIDSLKYPKPRLFGIQVPGKAPSTMLADLASIVGGAYYANNFDEEASNQLNQKIQSIFEKGQTYTFLIFDETTGVQIIENKVISNLDVSWKTVEVEEALCMGPNPTASDRLLAIKLADQISLWVMNEYQSGKLFVLGRDIIFQEN